MIVIHPVYMIQLQDHRFIHPSQHPVLLDEVNIFTFVTFITPTKIFDETFFYVIGICESTVFTKNFVIFFRLAFKMLCLESKSIDSIKKNFLNATTHAMAFISTIPHEI